MTDLAPRWRIPLLVAGFAGLVTGVLAGLWRLGWPMPALAAGAPHGVLMMCAFFGTLISLERAVAIGRRWAYAAPLIGGVAGLMLIAGLPVRLAAGAFAVAGLCFVAASWTAQRRQRALHTRVLTLGAVHWLVGVLLLLGTGEVTQAQWWWLGFLIVTIAGERLELSRLVRVSRGMQRGFVLIIAALTLAAAVAALPLGERLFGLSLIALALWLLRQDVARRTVRSRGLTRYIALCLLSGYVWLLVGGTLLLGAPQPGQPGWDSAVHALTIGFVLAMVFGHAPIIFPAVLRRKLPYHWGFYVPLIGLHLTLAARIAGDLAGRFPVRADGALGNALSVALFLLMMAAAMIAARPGSTS
ncbi:hypothetical protein G3580_16020 [Nitrogeniibacter mangrovi]|uniref:NnrS family protein n=1 Tax=Nitrogeniibacter mangrovi TaxID=2016596 RepID=A0A6C1B5M5_9RHOO|nr:hypothetical protein [Nitrogeniibacter mangrovi]QID18991.1 hypothetical protein G3580_16020 [Nitrogeniibacter mangrovi]